MWDAKLKLINRQQYGGTRGKVMGEVVKGKGGGKCMVMEDHFTLGGKHTMQYTDHVIREM